MTRLLFLLLSLAWLLPGQTLSQGERDIAMSHLHATRKQVLDAVAGLSPAQWNYKPGPDRWSVAEVVEHLALTEDTLFQQIQRVLKQPAQPEMKAQAAGRDEAILKAVADRSKPVTTSAELTPKATWKTREEMLSAFRERRDRTIAFVDKTQEDLRSHFAQGPAGNMDAYQWVLMIAAHTSRHLGQIQEVKDNAGFPKR